MTGFDWLVLAALLALGTLSLFTFHKVRRIHVATFKLMELSSETHREALALFGQMQALGALQQRLGLERCLPPMRGWAGSPDFLLSLTNELLERRSKVVMECSSGVSTLVSARCMQINGGGHVYSLEHEAQFAEATRRLLRDYGFQDFATVIDAPLQSEGGQSPWYSLDGLPDGLPPVDVLVVDGPPASGAPLARYPALPRLKSRLAAKCSVYVDDADRPSEQETIRRWLHESPEFSAEKVYCEKGLTILRR